MTLGASSKTPRILAPLPHYGFDPSETAIPWKILTENHYELIFATPNGKKSQADQKTLTGKGLPVWSRYFLRANKNTRIAYKAMDTNSHSFNHPIAWKQLEEINFLDQFDGILITGGHAKEMKELIESPIIHRVIQYFFQSNKPVGAICHGVLAVARCKTDAKQSILFNKRSTGLLDRLEKISILLGGKHYQTYPETVQQELQTKWLKHQNQFITGPGLIIPFLPSHAFCLRDGNYISARWPGDAEVYAKTFMKLVDEMSVISEKADN